MSRNRYLAKDVRKRLLVVPKHLAEIPSSQFFALIEEQSAGKSKWFVELRSLSFARLSAAAKLSKHLIDEKVREISKLQSRRKELERDLAASKAEYDSLCKKHHDFVKTVVQEDGRIRIPRSPKNYLEVASEKGTNYGTPAIQGGLAGLEKK